MNKDQKEMKGNDKNATHSKYGQSKGADYKSSVKKTDTKKEGAKKSAPSHSE